MDLKARMQAAFRANLKKAVTNRMVQHYREIAEGAQRENIDNYLERVDGDAFQEQKRDGSKAASNPLAMLQSRLK